MRRSLVLGGLATANVLLGFVSQWYVVTTLGPGRHTDALFAGLMVPQFVLVLIAGTLTNVLVPFLATLDDDRFAELGWTVFQGVGVILGGLSVLLAVTATFWVPVLVPGFDAATRDLAIHLTRIQVIGIVGSGLVGVQWAMHHARHRFRRAELSPVIASLVSLGFLIWLLPVVGVVAAAWATVVKAGLQVLLLLPGMGWIRRPRWRSPAVAQVWRRVGPLMFGAAYYKTDVLVDRALVSLAPAGLLSLYHIAQQLYASGSMVLNRAVMAPVVPALAREAAGAEWDRFARRGRRTIGVMLAVTGACILVLAFAGRSVLDLVFGYGEFDVTQIRSLWLLLLLLGGVLLGGAVGQVLSGAFYAAGDTRTPARIGVVGFTIALLLKVGGVMAFGVWGVAGAASLYYLLNASLLHRALGRRLDRLRIKTSVEALAHV